MTSGQQMDRVCSSKTSQLPELRWGKSLKETAQFSSVSENMLVKKVGINPFSAVTLTV